VIKAWFPQTLYEVQVLLLHAARPRGWCMMLVHKVAGDVPGFATLREQWRNSRLLWLV
jgi:hypothetical protein